MTKKQIAKFNKDTRDSIKGKNNYKPHLGAFPNSPYNARQVSEGLQPHEVLPQAIERDFD